MYKHEESNSPKMQEIQAAFLAAYDAYSRELLGHAIIKIGDEDIAKDILSETFLKVWQYIQKNEVKNMRAFLYRVQNNLIIDHYRSKPKEAILIENLAEEAEPSELTLEENVDRKISFEDARRYLQTLPTDYREIFAYRFIQGLEIKEIKEITGKSLGNIYVILHRGLKILKSKLKAND